jgi:hypothetical protein
VTLKEAAERIVALEEANAQLVAEMRFYRRGKPRADAAAIESLLEYIADEFGQKPWATKWLLEGPIAHPLLRGAIVRCVGEQPTAKGLSRFLGQHLGQWGNFVLQCTSPRSNEGVRYSVTISQRKPVSLRRVMSQEEKAL